MSDLSNSPNLNTGGRRLWVFGLPSSKTYWSTLRRRCRLAYPQMDLADW
jgi:hypothetical protein